MANKLCVVYLFAALLGFSQCGPIDTDQHIVGGVPADVADFPHKLALLDLTRAGSTYQCGASNIHRFWALSAAHCLERNTPPSQINLIGGSTSRLTGGFRFIATRYINHPDYNTRTLDFDISLIEVEHGNPMENLQHVRAIPLPPSCTAVCCGVCADSGPQTTVVGWGRVDDGSLPENLMQVSKDIMTNARCSTYWTGITNRMFCTIIEDGRDSCNGDSGSAVLRNGIQVGVVSFGSAVCGDGSRPAVYVRVEQPQIRDWITGFVGI